MTSTAQGQALYDISELAPVEKFNLFLEHHYGSALKAWRFQMDPSGDGVLLYQEFIESVATMPRLQCDITVLWKSLMQRASVYDNDNVLRLRELSEEDYMILEEFKTWADKKIGGACEMFKITMQGKSDAGMSFSMFESTCKEYGYDGDVNKIFFGCLCGDGSEVVSVRDMAYLESDAIKRKGAMDPSFVMMQNAAKAQSKRVRQRKRRLKKGQDNAMREFLKKLRKVSASSLIRGWRRILDQSGNLAISKTELLRGCKKIAFEGDVVALWKHMDVDDDGIVMLEEVDTKLALVLAHFKKWASDLNGSCVATMLQLGALTRRKIPKWTSEDFAAALRAVQYNGPDEVTPKMAANILYEAFDVSNSGSFTAQDVSFLDKWNPTPWLVAEPNHEGAESFIAGLRAKYPSLLVAWRKVLDQNNSNRVNYKEFVQTCRTMRLSDAPGIWRALDDDASGYITIEEVDQNAADTLLHFKAWAESTFGTIHRMYYVFDKSRTNKVSFQVFRRELRNFGFQGDEVELFHSLKPEGGKNSKNKGSQRELSLDDMLYLSTWECDDEDSEDGDGDSSKVASAKASPTANRQAPPQQKKQQASGTPTSGMNPMSRVPHEHEQKAANVMHFCRSAKEYEAYERAGAKAAAAAEQMREERSLLNLYLPHVNTSAQKRRGGYHQKLARDALPLIPKLPPAQRKAVDHLQSLGVLRPVLQGRAGALGNATPGMGASVSLPALLA